MKLRPKQGQLSLIAQAELAVQFPQPGEQPLETNLAGLLRARLLHWTGPRRHSTDELYFVQ